jgi:quinol monooxygenase YgiN
MTAFSVVRYRVKPNGIAAFVAAHERATLAWPGLRRFSLVDAGDNSFFLVGEWDDLGSLASARPHLISVLDSFRHTLEDLGGGLGVTDPISGTAVLELTPPG